MSKSWALGPLMVGAIATLSCKSNPPSDGTRNPWVPTDTLPKVGYGGEQTQYWDLNPVRDVDLLFVVQNTRGMAARQKALAEAVPGILDRLGAMPGGLPNLHIGVVTTDLGAGLGVGTTGACARPGGDRAIFFNGNCGLDANSRFLASFDGGRQNNFPGKLADVASCLVQVGETGCEFPHTLQAARVALYEAITPENQGFLRRDAYLFIVVLADRDDCSAETSSTLFRDDVPGQQRTLRCALEGHTCGGARPTATDGYTAPLDSCRATDGGLLIKTSEVVESIRALKQRPDQQISLIAIAGWPGELAGATYRYARQADGRIGESPVCDSALGQGWAGLRLQATVEEMGMNSKLVSACGPDLVQPATTIADAISAAVYRMCLAAPALASGAATQPHCQVTLREPTTSGTYRDRPLPTCRDGGERPCARYVEEPACKESGLRLELDAGGEVFLPGAMGVLRCALSLDPGPEMRPPPCTGPMCPTPNDLGQRCLVHDGQSTGVMSSPTRASFRGDAPECAGNLCLRPARDMAVARVVDTEATCTRGCAADADCATFAERDRRNPSDRRCAAGYTCAVPFEVGPLCCRKVCVCKDFLPSGPAGSQPPASCSPSVPAAIAACPNRPQ